MVSVTLTVAIICSVLVLFLPLPYALAAYVAAVVWYPEHLRISIGTIDISVGRIVVAVLLARCLYDSRLRSKFVWTRLDTLVTISMVIYVGMYLITRPFWPAFENRGGFLMDTWFTYMVVRLIITDRAAMVSFLKATGIVLAALAMLGVIEAVTHWQPFMPLRRFRPWNPIVTDEGEAAAATNEVVAQYRWGFSRAIGSFGHPIMFGLCFIMFLPLFWALRHERRPGRMVAYLFSTAAVVGALSSMSGGPWFALGVTLFLLFMERYRHWIKQGLILFVIACVLAEIGSNRPLYHVIVSYANPLGGSGWQRAKIIDCAIEDFDKWWLAGYGGQDPGWGPRTGVGHTDPNNLFIASGIDYGIWGLIALCTVYVSAFAGVVRVYKSTSAPHLRAWAWAVGVSIIATAIAGMGVTFFGAPDMLLYCIFGLAGSLSNLQREVLVSQKGSYLHATRRPDTGILEGAKI